MGMLSYQTKTERTAARSSLQHDSESKNREWTTAALEHSCAGFPRRRADYPGQVELPKKRRLANYRLASRP